MDLPLIRAKIEELRFATEQPGFWNGNDAQNVSKELSRLQGQVDMLVDTQKEIEDLSAASDLLSEEADEELNEEFYLRADKLRRSIEDNSILILLDGEYDAGNAIMTVHTVPAGWTSQDWAEMLYRNVRTLGRRS